MDPTLRRCVSAASWENWRVNTYFCKKVLKGGFILVLMVNNLYLSFILIPQNTPPFLFTFLSIITIIIII